MDIRSQITQTNFTYTLLQCIKNKPLSQIKVKDIIDVSGMSSRTFYQHYQDTADLLQTIEDQLYHDFQRALDLDNAAIAKLGQIKQPLKKEDLIKVAEGLSKNTIDFFIKNQEKITLLTSDHGDIKFLNTLIRIANDVFEMRMEKINPNYKEVLAKQQSIPVTEVLQIFDATMINVVLQLINYNDELSPADMRRYIAGYLTRTPLEFLGLIP